jgi:membrane-associated phospholipid phosphatase
MTEPNLPPIDPSPDDPTVPRLSPEGQKIVAAVRKALEAALVELQSEEEADALVDRVMTTVAAMDDATVEELRTSQGLTSATEAQAAIERAANTAVDERLQRTLIEAARQIVRSEAGARAALEEAIQEATNPEQIGAPNPQTRQSRNRLLRALLKRMGPVQRIDTRLFLLINGLPHTSLTNRMMHALTTVMNGGGGWALILIATALVDGKRGRRALYGVLPPLWLATMAVEYPIKGYFRRRRPFLDVVQAVAVGRKPMTYSFPSGHSASGFAGAWLLRRHYPEFAGLWYTIAGLVGFSRVYLGVHYPGDVIVGALSGALIAELSRWAIERSQIDG